MAQVQLVPGSINPTARAGAVQYFQSSQVSDFTGAAIDLSAWVSLTAKLVPISTSPNTSDVTFGVVTGSAGGIVTLEMQATDLASAQPGTANLVITGKPTAGDAAQTIATGTFSLLQG